MDSGDGGPDLLVGHDLIQRFLIALGMPETTSPYYLKRIGWPIGNLNGDRGALVASKQRLKRYAEKLTGG